MVRQEGTGPEAGSGVRPPRFTGRERELAAFADALARPPAVVLVEGEAGIGKSRLVREFLDSPVGRELTALTAGCPPYRQPHTLGPLIGALRRAAPEDMSGLGLTPLAGALRPLFPEWAGSLPASPEPAEDASAARHRVFRAMAELLGYLDVGLLVVEDAHWADEATLEFLLYLTAEMRLPRLVVTYRPQDVPARSLLPRLLSRPLPGTTRLRLALAPLDVPGTAALVSSMLADQPLSDGFAKFMHDRTEGLPLAIEEVVRVMSDRADLARRRDGWMRRHLDRIEVPPTVRDAVLERTGHLSPETRAVLRAAAVLGTPEPDDVLAVVAGLDAARARDGLTEGLASGLLGEGDRGSMTFRHVLARQAVYDDIPGPQRRAMHLRAGEELEGTAPPPLAQLAQHFRETGDIERWRRYGEQAADRALTVGDETTAANLLHDLITGARLPPSEIGRLAGKVVLLLLPRHEQLTDLVRVLREALDTGELTPPEKAGLRFQLGRTLLTMGEHDTGRAELERAVAHLPAGSLPAARAMMMLGWPEDKGRPASAHLRWLAQAGQVTGSLEPAERLRLAIDRTTALLLLGEETGWAAAAGLPDGEPAPGERLQMARAHGNIGEAAIIWGRYEEAKRRLERATELARTYGYRRLQGDFLAVQARLHFLTGAWDGLADRANALAEDEDLQPADWLEAALVTRLLRIAEARPAEAAENLRHILDETLRHGSISRAMVPAAALSRLRLAEEAVAEALEITDEPAGIVARKQTWIWATELAPARVDALVAAGRAGDAAELVAAFARGLRGRDAPAAKAGLALCRAILTEARGDEIRAAGMFSRAAAAWQALPRPYDALLARERQGRCLLAAPAPGERERGLRVLSEAFRGLGELGARHDADRVRHTLRANGVDARPPSRRGRRGYGDELSPRELEVVRLVAAGRTDREIAGSLFLSPRTVAYHLDSARRKLKAPSRTALVISAMNAGLIDGNGTTPAAGPTDPAN